MLKRYSAFFVFFRVVIDITIAIGTWLFVYYMRFCSGIFSHPEKFVSLNYHVKLSIPIIALCYLAFSFSGLYKPIRIQSFLELLLSLLKAVILSGLFIMTFLYYARQEPYSRKLLFMFLVFLFFGL